MKAIGIFSLSFLLSACLQAVSSAEVNMTIHIISLDAIHLSGSPPPFILRPDEAGDPFCRAIDQSTTYAVTTNNRGRSIYGSLNKNLPHGIIMQVHMAPPNGAVSLGAVPLSTANNRLVSSISHTREGSLAITYFMNASSAMKPAFDYHTLTYTIGP